VAPDLPNGADSRRARRGVLWVDAASLTVEVPGREPDTLDTHVVEGLTGTPVASPALSGVALVPHTSERSQPYG
jgi:hypothetical protein